MSENLLIKGYIQRERPLAGTVITARACQAPTRAHNLPRSGGSKPEGVARGCEAPERAKRAEPEGLVTHVLTQRRNYKGFRWHSPDSWCLAITSKALTS